VSLYRKWRPQSFDEIAGQSHVTQTLKNAIERGRLSHAYLFCGPRGTGKTTTARILAKAINCENGATTNPCNECESCRSIVDGNSIDVLELDAASNRKVDEIRDFLEKIPYSSTQGGKKVYIIDEVHMLTTESFNTLLKTLEEPPEHVVFILATTEPNKVLPTILSRCQRFDFRRISVADIEARLKTVAEAEGINIDPAALGLISGHVQGAMRDALGILEQLASYAKELIAPSDVTALLGITDAEILFKFTTMLVEGDLAGCLVFLDELVCRGQDIRQFMQDLLGYLRDIYLVKSVDGVRAKNITDEMQERFEEQAASVNSRSVLFYINTLNEVYNQSRWSTDIRLQFEIALFKMIKTGDDVTLEGLLYRIERLENALMSGGGFLSTPGAPSRAETVSRASSGVSKSDDLGKNIDPASPKAAGLNPGAADKADIEGFKEVIWVKPEKPVSGDGINKGQTAAESSSVATKVQQDDKAAKRPLIEPVIMVTDDQPLQAGVNNGAMGNSSHTGASGMTTGAEAGVVNVETIQKYWPQVMKLIKEKKRARYPFFAAAKVKRVEDGKLVLAVKPAERQFIENQESLSLLRNALKIASGIDIQIICEALGEKVRTVAVSDPVVSGDIGEDHDEILGIGDYIKRVQDAFGAKIVEDITLGD
jgi:DNA polymerase-3 subunit gamma/tau